MLFVSLLKFGSLFLFAHICSVFLCFVDKIQPNQILYSFTLASCMCVMDGMCIGEKRECIAQVVWCLWALDSLCCHTCFPLWRFHMTGITHAFKSRQPYTHCISLWMGPTTTTLTTYTYTHTNRTKHVVRILNSRFRALCNIASVVVLLARYFDSNSTELKYNDVSISISGIQMCETIIFSECVRCVLISFSLRIVSV